jgi:hypothetical protein
MTKKLLPLLLAVMIASPLIADDFIYQGSFLWNDIRAVVNIDSFLVCAFHDGVGVVNLNRDYIKKKLYGGIEISGGPNRLMVFDSLMVVECDDRGISLVDVSDPMNMVDLGSFNPGQDVYDLAILGDYLYAAVEYNGVVRFDISDPQNIHFDDSSMAGISVTELAVYGSRLYALDSYNGVLIYEPDADDIGAPVSELLLPKQGVSLSVFRDTVYAGVRPNGYLVGDVADVYHPEYLGERTSLIRGDVISQAGRGLVIANNINGFELIYDGADSVDQVFSVKGISGYLAVFTYLGHTHIAYPTAQRGFVAYDIEDPAWVDTDFPEFVYAYPGPITQVEFINSRLHVIGTNNWYEMYDVSDPGHPVRTGKMINPPWNPAGVVAKGDTLFVADKNTNTFFPALDRGVGDPEWVFPYFSVADSIARPHLIPGYFTGRDLLYFFNDHHFNGTARNDSTVEPNIFRWSFATGISAAVVDGSLLYRVSDKEILYIYDIDYSYDLEEQGQIDLPDHVTDMVKVDSLLYTLGSGLRTYNLSDPVEPQLVQADQSVGTGHELRVYGDRLFCATDYGIFVFDISQGIPSRLFSGGEAARTAAFDDQLIAASDGYSVKIYSMPLVDADDEPPLAIDFSLPRLRGFPNPFNPTITVIAENFRDGSGPIELDIFDVLGRRVRRLTLRADISGRDQVVWDGRDESGGTLGVYMG